MPESDTSTTAHPETRPVQPPGECAVLFYDGVCGLCNRFVNFVLKYDRLGALRMAPLQGETAESLLDAADRETVSSVVLLVGNQTFRRSAAVVRVLWRLGVVWKVVGTLLWLVPLPLRDLGYKLVARYRYQLFGKQESCRMPTSEERDRLLL